MSGAQGRWVPAYVGLGSNLDDPAARVRHALQSLRGIPDCHSFRRSGLYRSAPMGPQDQPDFVNAAAAFLTRLQARSLLKQLQAIETAQGRQRGGERWGPRRLDLDLLVFGHAVIDEDELQVPHPGISERNFVLLPLADIAPLLIVPGRGRVAQLLAALGDASPRIDRLEH